MDIAKLKTFFKEQFPDFVDFRNPGKHYFETEYGYKKAFSDLAHEMFDEWLKGPPDAMSAMDFKDLLHRLLRKKIPNSDVIQNLSFKLERQLSVV